VAGFHDFDNAFCFVRYLMPEQLPSVLNFSRILDDRLHIFDRDCRSVLDGQFLDERANQRPVFLLDAREYAPRRFDILMTTRLQPFLGTLR
jgi:hypothetical protein